MLTEDEEQGQGDAAVEAAEGVELEMLVAIAAALVAAGEYGLATAGYAALAAALNRIAAQGGEALYEAVVQAVQGGVVLDVAREAEYADAPREDAREAVSEAAKSAEAPARSVASLCLGYLQSMAEDGKDAYYRSLAQARADARTMGWRPAVEKAVGELAEQGVSAMTYMRRDGVQVRVPVDVCVRRAIENEGRQARMTEVLNAAERLGRMVEVSRTRNPRPSHRKWEGKVYTMEEFRRACKPGDPVDGIGGYNCGHRVALYKPGRKKRFEDPLEGTGYTREQASKLVSRQRAMENDLRKLKRAQAVLKSQGLDTAPTTRKIVAKQHDLAALVAENPKLLKRERHREDVHAKAEAAAARLRG